MMIFGVGYRLIPMFVPAAMPSGPGLGASAVLLETGTLGLTLSLLAGSTSSPSVIFILGAFVTFFWWIRRTLRDRRPRPTELPGHDWSTWQTPVAVLYLVVASALGCWLTWGAPPLAITWAYAATGILGFVAQMVAGIQGRLIPLWAWYRALEERDGDLPRQSVHRLIAPRLAFAIFLAWLVGLPILTVGLVTQHEWSIATGSAGLLVAVLMSAVHGAVIIRRARA
jgi:hypothetical protein